MPLTTVNTGRPLPRNSTCSENNVPEVGRIKEQGEPEIPVHATESKSTGIDENAMKSVLAQSRITSAYEKPQPLLGSINTNENTTHFKEKAHKKMKWSLLRVSLSSTKGSYSLINGKKEFVNAVRCTAMDSIAQKKLASNLQLATEVAGTVSQLVPKSTNAIESGRVYFSKTYTSADGQLMHQCVVPHEANDSEVLMQRENISSKASGWEQHFDLADELCRQSGVGNCYELAAMACKRLKEKGAEHVDYVLVSDGRTHNSVLPHVVAVVGRTESTSPSSFTKYEDRHSAKHRNISLPDRWDESAVICDPWARVAYPAKDYKDYWSGFKLSSKSRRTLTCMLLHRLPNK